MSNKYTQKEKDAMKNLEKLYTLKYKRKLKNLVFLLPIFQYGFITK